MWELARDFVARAANSPDDIAVVDATGEHTMAEVVAAATGLAAQLDAATGGSPTVLVQADNTWRTLAAAIAVGLRGGLIAVFSRHATPVGVRCGLGRHRTRRGDRRPAVARALGCAGEPVLRGSGRAGRLGDALVAIAGQ